MGEFLSDPSPAAPPHMPELVRRRDRRYQRFAAEELERFRNDDFNDGAGYDCLSHDIPRPAIDCGQSDPWLFQMSRAQKPLASVSFFVTALISINSQMVLICNLTFAPKDNR
jgi:hypothetical protein